MVATCRIPACAPALELAVAFAAEGSCMLPCDISSAQSVAALVAAIKEKYGEGTCLDLLVNNGARAFRRLLPRRSPLLLPC